MRALRVEHDTVAALPAPEPIAYGEPEAPEFPLVLVVWRDAFFDFDRKPDRSPVPTTSSTRSASCSPTAPPSCPSPKRSCPTTTGSAR